MPHSYLTRAETRLVFHHQHQLTRILRIRIKMPPDPAATANLNAAQPVARVMSIPELFSLIIHFALDFYMPHTYQCSKAPTLPMGVRVLGAAVVASHVCSAWRTMCIGTPSLWARQIGEIPHAATEFLARSGQSLVDIKRGHSSPWPATPFIESSRVRSLFSVSQDAPHDSEDFIQTMLSGSLHNLVTLVLDNTRRDPDFAFGGTHTLELAQLKFLTLRNVRLCSAVHAPKLRKLSVDGLVLPLLWLFNVLKVSSSLEKLMLDNCEYEMFIVAESQWGPSRYESIELSSLRSIDFFDDGGSDSAPDIFLEVLTTLRTSVRETSVILEGNWTEPLLFFCLRSTLENCHPNCLYIAESLMFYPEVDGSAPSLLPKMDNLCTYLGYFDLTWLASSLLHFGFQQELSNLAILVMHTGNAEFMDDDESKVRSVLCALPSVETYWVTNNTLTPYQDDKYLGEGRCLWQALAPGVTYLDVGERMPLPRLRTLGLGVHVDDPAQFLDDICDILTSREDEGLAVLDTLSFPLIPRPPDEDVVAELLSLSRAVHWAQSDPDDRTSD